MRSLRPQFSRWISARPLISLCTVLVLTQAESVPFAQTAGGTSHRQATLSVSAVVVPSCVLDTAPSTPGETSLTMRCQSKDFSRVRVHAAGTSISPSVPIADVVRASASPTVTRTQIVNGSLIHVDF